VVSVEILFFFKIELFNFRVKLIIQNTVA